MCRISRAPNQIRKKLDAGFLKLKFFQKILPKAICEIERNSSKQRLQEDLLQRIKLSVPSAVILSLCPRKGPSGIT